MPEEFVKRDELSVQLNNINSNLVGTANNITNNLVGTANNITNNLVETGNNLQGQITLNRNSVDELRTSLQGQITLNRNSVDELRTTLQTLMNRTTVSISYDFEQSDNPNLFNNAARVAEPLLKRMPLQAIVNTSVPEFNSSDTDEQRNEKLEKTAGKNIGDINFTIGFSYATATEKIAKENLDNTFVIMDSPTTGQLSNYTGTTFRMREATFLASLAAFRLFSGDKIGILLPFRFLSATNEFLYGVLEAGKVYGFEPIVKYISDEPSANAFNDPETARAEADEMYNEGARVIFAVVGNSGFGLLQSAQDRTNSTGTRHYVIWPDIEGQKVLPEYNDVILGSVLKNIGNAIVLLTQKWVTFNLDISDISLGLTENNSVSFVYNEDNNNLIVTEEMKKELEQEKEKIMNGEGIPSDPNYPSFF